MPATTTKLTATEKKWAERGYRYLGEATFETDLYDKETQEFVKAKRAVLDKGPSGQDRSVYFSDPKIKGGDPIQFCSGSARLDWTIINQLKNWDKAVKGWNPLQ